MFYKKAKTYRLNLQKKSSNKSYRAIVLFLLLICMLISNAQSDSIISVRRDSLVSTFPYLILDSAEQAKKNVEDALAINAYNPSIKVEAYGNYCLGNYHRIKGNNRTALKYYNKAFDIYNELDVPNRKVLLLNDMGISYKNLGEYDMAIETYVRGINIAEKYESNRLADVYSNLAVLYTLLKNYDQGLIYLFKSLELEDDLIGREVILLNIGVTYKELNKDSLAMLYLKKALKLCDENDLPTYYRNDALHNIADMQIENAKYDIGLAHLFEIRKHEESQNNLRDLAYTDLSIGLAYKKMNRSAKAHYYLNKSIDLSKKVENNEQLLKAYKILSNLYKEENNYKSSLEVFELYTQLKDSLFTIEKTKYTEDLLTDFDVDRKESEILLLKKEQELHQQELVVKQQSVRSHITFRNITIAVATLLLIGAFLIVFFYQQKVRDGQLLALKTEEVNKQNIFEMMRDHEFQSLSAGIKGRENERKRIAQELHDGIGGNLASIKLKLTNAVDENPNKHLQSIIKNIDDTYKEVRTISHDLVSFEIKDHTFTYLVEKFLNELSEIKGLKIKFNFFPEYKLNKLSNDIKIELYRIIQELMSNIIKHAQATQVDIQIIDRNESVNLMVEDNGIGYDTQTSTQGIGLKNIRSRVKSFNGTFNIDTSIGNWTLANIEIPINNIENQSS